MSSHPKVFTCPHNMAIHCYKEECERCGWYPPVAEKRKREIMSTKTYQIPFTGHCEVFATSPEEAAEKARNGELLSIEHVFGDPITDEEVSE